MAAGMTTAVRDALASLSRSFKRVSMYRHARDQHAAYVEEAVAELRSVLELRPSVTVGVEPGALVYEGEVVHSEPARETGFCFRLHRDGVRTLTFRRGLGVEEVLALAYVAMADPQAEGGREDAVTELWKADLAHIAYSAGAGYRMGESAGDASKTLSEITARVQEVVDRHVGDSFVEVTRQAALWTDAQRAKGDPQDYAALARRGALTILRIVEQDYAGWDLQALEESFWRLVDQLLEREQPQAIAVALDRLRRTAGSHAAGFRGAVGQWLADAGRLERVVKLATGAEKPPLLPAWFELLPPESGPVLLSLLPLGREAPVRAALAEAAAKRIDSCAAQVEEMLRKGSAAEARALLSAVSGLPPARRAALAMAAFGNADDTVKLEAIPLVAAEPGTAVKALAPALTSSSRALRIAAAQAVAGCGAVADQAAALLLAAIDRPQFGGFDKDEHTVFYRSLGKLGSRAGLAFLLERLKQPARKLFGRRKVVAGQLLAVQGLAEDGSTRALKALEEALLPSRGYPPAVVAACRAAAQHVRTAARGGKTG